MGTIRKVFSLLTEKDAKSRHECVKKLSKKQTRELLEVCLSALDLSSVTLEQLSIYGKEKIPDSDKE